MSDKKPIIGITGAYGFLGWHMRCFLHSQGINNARLAGRETFSSEQLLQDFVRDCDVIFHFAGVNRASNDIEIAEGNPVLAGKLVDAMRTTGSRPFVIYSSSTHVLGDNLYGKAKREAGERIQEWAIDVGAQAAILVFPHLYGEGGRPFYNSVVHTFCHQLAHGDSLAVSGNAALQLLHAQDAVEFAWSVFQNKQGETFSPKGREISVVDLAELLTSFHEMYKDGIIPDLRNAEDCKLFNTLRSNMFPKAYPIYSKLRRDPRGWLFEAVKEMNGGQVFLSSTNPGFTRGNHYHRYKVERFCVLSGKATIRIRKLFSDEIYEFPVSGEKPGFIDMPPLHTHSISNDSDSEVLTLFWANEFFDPENPDTYPATVIQDQD